MVENTQEDEEFGIDLASYIKERDENLEDSFIDLEEYAREHPREERQKSGWLQTIGDVFTQGGRGALRAFTWPADILKLGIIGEGLSGVDEFEEASRKLGKSFDREGYIKAVFDQARYIPTQELAEQGFEKITGISLQPKTEIGKGAKQLAEIAAFTPGSAAKKLTSATIGSGATQVLKGLGVGEGKAELAGDIASLSPALTEKAPRALSKAAKSTEQTARKHALPFLEYMAKERVPFVKGRISENAEKRLMDQFKLTSEEAIDRLITGEIPLKRYQDRGVNLDTLAERLYARAERKASKSNNIINTGEMVKNIDNEIARIHALAPSPSDAQKSAIKLLENERDILKVSKPTPLQLMNQHKNYNADMKAIYAKPEFNGKEEQVRKTYEFLKDQLVSQMEQQGAKEVSESFKFANKIYHNKSKLDQTESILEKAFDGEKYNPKKLQKILHSKEGNYLRRNIGDKAVQEVEEISKYGREAQEKIGKFIELNKPSIFNTVKSWGQLAPFIFLPHNLKGASLAFAPALSKRIQGKLLTRPAAREAYKLTLKHAAEGAFNLLKKDFMQIEKEIQKEWGTVDDMMDDMMDELSIFGED